MANFILDTVHRLEAVFATPQQRQSAHERATHAVAIHGSSAALVLRQKLADKRRRKSKSILRLAIYKITSGQVSAPNAAERH